MPTYEYECGQCGHVFEMFQNMSDKVLDKCPKCGGRIKRLIGRGAGIIFKGSGFYATDYGKSSSGGAACGRDRPCCGRDMPCDRSPRLK
ncbi:MAG: FmdB family zinc ribbon protein [Kiritimatiellia bacterium]